MGVYMCVHVQESGKNCALLGFRITEIFATVLHLCDCICWFVCLFICREVSERRPSVLSFRAARICVCIIVWVCVCVCVLSDVILYKYAQMLILEWLFNYHLNSRGLVSVCDVTVKVLFNYHLNCESWVDHLKTEELQPAKWGKQHIKYTRTKKPSQSTRLLRFNEWYFCDV